MRSRYLSATQRIGIGRLWSEGGLFVLVLACLAFSPLVKAQIEAADSPASRQTHNLTIRDGTPVHLRFAQPIYGLAVASREYAVKEGTKVRLVVGVDVRVDDKIVVAKGALAQATVMRVWKPNPPLKRHSYDLVFTGLSLRLDWVNIVTGAQAPLRPHGKGSAKRFDVDVVSAKGGIEVTPHNSPRRMFSAMMGADLFTGRAFHEKQWIPAGARLLAFLDGDVAIGRAELEQAQANLPAPNLTATLYVFRTKDGGGPSPRVGCDQTEVGSLGSRQSAVADLVPGKHSCRAGTSPPIELTVEGGNDYYLWLQQSAASEKWELKRVTTEEGEDRSANIEMLPPRPPANESHGMTR